MTDGQPIDRHEIFHRGVALLLGKLFASFPVQEGILDVNELDDSGPEAREIYASTLDFLISEGFVSGRRVAATGPIYRNVGLTLKGIGLLQSNADPQSRSWGQRLTDAARSAGSGAAAVAGKELMRAAATWGMQKVTSLMGPS